MDAQSKSVHFRDCGLAEQVDPPDTSTSTTTQIPDSTTTSPDDTINTTTEPEVDSGYSDSCNPRISTDCRHTYLTCRDGYCGCVFGRVYDPTTRSCVTGKLTISHLQTHFDANSSRHLLKTVCPKVKLPMMSNFSFGHNVFNFSFNNLAIFYGSFSGFCHHVFKFVCCRFAVCGKRLR